MARAKRACHSYFFIFFLLKSSLTKSNFEMFYCSYNNCNNFVYYTGQHIIVFIIFKVNNTNATI